MVGEERVQQGGVGCGGGGGAEQLQQGLEEVCAVENLHAVHEHLQVRASSSFASELQLKITTVEPAGIVEIETMNLYSKTNRQPTWPSVNH